MNKWLRRALLGGVAMTVMAAGAQADELEALKAQLEALQARVATIETRGATLPEGVSLITFERGQQAGALTNELFDNNVLDQAPASRGMTISVTPTADLPAPVASIELSGYVRAMAVFVDTNLTRTDFDMYARGQVDLAATVDTAVGRVTGGIQVRGDMGGNDGIVGYPSPRRDRFGRLYRLPSNSYTENLKIRTAWATWQMTDALSMTFGETGQIAALSNVSSVLAGVSLDPVGVTNSRRPQLRFTFADGPFNFRLGIEDPSQDARARSMPDFAASMGFDMGMVGFRAGGEVGRVSNPARKTTGYLFNAGLDFELGSMATFNIGGAYTKGLGCDGLINVKPGVPNVLPGVSCLNGTQKVKVYAGTANLNFNMTETTTLALSGGYFNASRDPLWDDGYSIGGALVWRPVDALQFGLAGSYYNLDPVGAGRKIKVYAVGVAGWFFF